MKTLLQSGLGVLGLLLAFTNGSACSGGETTTAVSDCVPGASQACAGPMGCSGFQVCAADGKSFSACDCGGGTGGVSASSSTGGTGTSGSATGGAGQGGTGQGGAGQGGTGQGGMPTTGTGGNPTDCDPMQPQNGDMCMTPVVGCVYGDQHCECWFGGGGQAWDCDTCPMQQPTNGDPCMSGGGTTRCFYGTTTCACLGGGGQSWSCNTCPAQEPMDNDPCTEIGIHCVFTNSSCSCSGNPPQWSCF